jgi:hypothetical protein
MRFSYKRLSVERDYHLDSDHQDCLEVKASFADREQVLETLAKNVHDHHVEMAVLFGGISADIKKTGHTSYRKKL